MFFRYKCHDTNDQCHKASKDILAVRFERHLVGADNLIVIVDSKNCIKGSIGLADGFKHSFSERESIEISGDQAVRAHYIALVVDLERLGLVSPRKVYGAEMAILHHEPMAARCD